MKLKYCSIMLSIILSMVGRALAEEPSTQYQWTDPKTGKIVTRDYPPANLQMRQVERRGNLVILEVIGSHNFSDSVNLATPKSVETSSGDAVQNCFLAVKEKLKDPYSAVLEGIAMERDAHHEHPAAPIPVQTAKRCPILVG